MAGLLSRFRLPAETIVYTISVVEPAGITTAAAEDAVHGEKIDLPLSRPDLLR
jgi:hypothetical protein